MEEPVYHVVEDVFEDVVRSLLRGLSSLRFEQSYDMKTDYSASHTRLQETVNRPVVRLNIPSLPLPCEKQHAVVLS
jgi:hypothetical protein